MKAIMSYTDVMGRIVSVLSPTHALVQQKKHKPVILGNVNGIINTLLGQFTPCNTQEVDNLTYLFE